MEVGNNFENFTSEGVAGIAGGSGNHCMMADGCKKLANGQFAFDNVNSWGADLGPVEQWPLPARRGAFHRRRHQRLLRDQGGHPRSARAEPADRNNEFLPAHPHVFASDTLEEMTMDPLDSARQKLADAYFGTGTQMTMSPIIDALLQLLPTLLATCGLTPSTALAKAKNYPRLARNGIALNLAENGSTDPQRAAAAFIEAAAKTDVTELTTVLNELAAQPIAA